YRSEGWGYGSLDGGGSIGSVLEPCVALRLEAPGEHAAGGLICRGEVLQRAVVVPEPSVQLGERQCDVHRRSPPRVPATLLRPLCQNCSAVHRRVKCHPRPVPYSPCAGMVSVAGKKPCNRPLR